MVYHNQRWTLGARWGMAWLNLDLVPMAISSVLSSFIFNLLSPIHSATSSIQSFKQQAKTGKSEGTLDLWSWELSAKKYEWPDWQITVLKGCVYRVNRRGPRTEPCGTPHWFQNSWGWFMTHKHRLSMATQIGDKPIKDRARTAKSAT